ncbi:hypothetical protein NCC49_004044 [Naganishia albida]|nr:hypothetical protein NCC49_004044 [Naganishia albida]
MLVTTTAAATLFGGLLSVVHSSPVARDNDGARPISWQDPSGNYFCWAAEGLIAGSQIGVATCDGSRSQSFIYNEGATSIQVSGTDLCVEFGPGLGRNGTPLRLQTCRRNGAPGQRLFVTGDSHVALQNGPGQCADVSDAQGPLQSWRCVSDNTNQVSNAPQKCGR